VAVLGGDNVEIGTPVFKVAPEFCLEFCHLTPPLCGNPQNFRMKLALEKLEGWGYRMVKIS